MQIGNYSVCTASYEVIHEAPAYFYYRNYQVFIIEIVKGISAEPVASLSNSQRRLLFRLSTTLAETTEKVACCLRQLRETANLHYNYICRAAAYYLHT